MHMHTMPAGWAGGDRATVTITGRLAWCGGTVHMLCDDGSALPLPGEGAHFDNPPSKHANLPAGTLSWRTQ